MTTQQFQGFFPSDRQVAFEASWAQRHDVPAESMAQYRHQTVEGYRMPDIAKNFRTWCDACAWIESPVVHLPPMNPKAGRLITTLAKSMHNEYVKAIEASGARVAP